MKSIAILGKGTSVLECSKEFIDSHDEVCIINDIVFTSEYEPYIGRRADFQFCNSSTDYYSRSTFELIGLKKLFFHGNEEQRFKPVPEHYRDIELIYIKPNIHALFASSHGFAPSGGVQALYHFTSSREYNTISLIGFDFYQVGSTPYYYKLEEGSAALRNEIIHADYKNYIINKPSGHNSEKSIDFCHNLMLSHLDVQFNIISNCKSFTSLSSPNIKYITVK